MGARPARIRILLVPPRRDGVPSSPPDAARSPGAEPRPGAPRPTRSSLAAHGAVVIDVLRSTTSLAYAFAAGAREALFYTDVDGVRAAVPRVRRPFLQCGEREGLRIGGFDLGNSPLEYTPERVRGATLLFASTNGSLAFLATHDAQVQWAVAFVNLEAGVRAAAEWLEERGEAPAGGDGDLLVVCSGKLGEPAVEDTACAARFALRLMQRLAAAGRDVEVTADGGALALAPESEEETRRLVADSPHGRYLAGLGAEFEADLAVCARWDVLDVVPRGRGARLRG